MGHARNNPPTQARVGNGIAALLALTAAWSLLLAPAPAAHASSVPTPEEHMRHLINAEREARDLSKLTWGRRLTRVAVQQSHDMAEARTLFHNPRLPRVYDRLGCTILGENVGVVDVTTDAIQAIDALHQGFMASPSHRKNVLRPVYDRVGIGALKSGGRIWISVLFMA